MDKNLRNPHAKKEPVSILKNGLVLPIQSLRTVDTPFKFLGIDGREYAVAAGDTPVYFLRKRMRIENNKAVADYVHRICVGTIRPDGTNERHWLMPDGNYAEPCTEPVKIIKERK